MSAEPPTRDELIASIQAQLGPCEVSDLEAHLKRNVLFEVSGSLDLLQVALALAEDAAHLVQPWIEKEQLRRVAPAQLEAWKQEKSCLKSAIVAPWVLVQVGSSDGVNG